MGSTIIILSGLQGARVLHVLEAAFAPTAAPRGREWPQQSHHRCAVGAIGVGVWTRGRERGHVSRQ